MEVGCPVPRLWALAAGMVAVLAACAGGTARLEPADPAVVTALDRLRPHPCNRTVAAALDGYDVAIGDIRDLTYTEQRNSGDDKNRVTGYLAWIGLANQPGRLVVETDVVTCRLVQVYTRYGASVPGVSAF